MNILKTIEGYALSRWIVWPIRKWAKDKKRHFTEEYTQMANKPVNRCSAPLTISENANQDHANHCIPTKQLK